ncbi:MAG: dockerin type I repeat-containing protein [Oscillospiraceae bacterium]|nr:dockerin type I repeat-containing protein [Oscillospiraceae bacterium]
MKHKQGKRILSFFLALVLLASVTSVGASAWWSNTVPSDYKKGVAICSVGQAATLLCDMIDGILAGLGVKFDAGLTDPTFKYLKLDLSSIDGLASTLPDLIDKLGGTADGLVDLGSLLELQGKFDGLRRIATDRGKRDRGNTARDYANSKNEDDKVRDIQVLQNLFVFLKNASPVLGKLVSSYDGSFSFGDLQALFRGEGLIGWVVGLAVAGFKETVAPIADMMDQMSASFPGFLKEMLGPTLGLENPNDDLDVAIQGMIDGMIGPLLAGLLPGTEVNLSLNLSADSFYDTLRGLINGAIEQIGYPLLTDLLAPLLGIDENGQRTTGDMIGELIWSELVAANGSGLLGLGPVPHSQEALGYTKTENGETVEVPGDARLMLTEALQYLLMRGSDGTGFLDNFLVRDYPDVLVPHEDDMSIKTMGYDYMQDGQRGLYLAPCPPKTDNEGNVILDENGEPIRLYDDALSAFLGNLIGLVLPIVIDASIVSPEELGDLIDSLNGMPLNEGIALIGAKVLVPLLFDYMHIPDDVKTLRQLATYILVDMMAEIMPEKKYDVRSGDAYWPGRGWENIPNFLDINPRFKSTATIINPYTDGVYVVLGDLLRYYMNPALPNLDLPANRTFDGIISYLSGWVFTNYGGVLRSPASTTDAWESLTHVLFGGPTNELTANDGLLRRDWFPNEIEQSSPVLKELLLNCIVNGVLDLNFTSLFSIFRSNSATSAELNKPPMKVVINIVTRLLNLVLKVPTGQSIIADSVVQLDDPANVKNSTTALLSCNGLKQLITTLCAQVGEANVSSAILGAVLPLLAGMIPDSDKYGSPPLFDADSYLPRWKDGDTVATKEAMIEMLEKVAPIQQEEVDWTDPSYVYYGAENFVFNKLYVYNFYQAQRAHAVELVNTWDDPLPTVEEDYPENYTTKFTDLSGSGTPYPEDNRANNPYAIYKNPDVYQQLNDQNQALSAEKAKSPQNQATIAGIEAQIAALEAKKQEELKAEWYGEYVKDLIYDRNNTLYLLTYYTDGLDYPVLSAERSDMQVSNGGLEYQHLRDTLMRVMEKDYNNDGGQTYTRDSWANFIKAYNYAFDLMDRYYDSDYKGVKQAQITRARRELTVAEKGLRAFSQPANYTDFDIYLPLLETKYFDESSFYKPEIIVQLKELLDRVWEFPHDYDKASESLVIEITKEMKTMYSKLETDTTIRSTVLHPLGVAKSVAFQDAAVCELVNSNVKKTVSYNKIIYNLPYGLSIDGEDNLQAKKFVMLYSNATQALIYSQMGVVRSNSPTQANTLNTKKFGVTYMGTGSKADYTVFVTRNPYTITFYDGVVFLIFGDINGDGFVDVADILLLYQAIAGKADLDPVQMLAADVDHSGYIDVSDLRSDVELLRKATLGRYKIDQSRSPLS